MDDFSIEGLAKEIVVAQLKAVEDPPAAAGAVAKDIVVKAVTSTQAKQNPHVTVSAACKGVMAGMLLLEKDLPRTAVSILQQMGAVAQETSLDPAELMTWAMEGIAPVAAVAGEEARFKVQESIEAAFMGAGEVFARCSQPGA